MINEPTVAAALKNTVRRLEFGLQLLPVKFVSRRQREGRFTDEVTFYIHSANPIPILLHQYTGSDRR